MPNDGQEQCYVAKKPCGCTVAAIVDDPGHKRHTARLVADWIKDGLLVERAPTGTVRSVGCKCGGVQQGAKSMSIIKPWHDSAPCPVEGCGGLLAPMEHGMNPAHLTEAQAKHVHCIVCGRDHMEEDLMILIRIWWSAGAYEGKMTPGVV